MNLHRSLCICLVLLLFFSISGSVLSQLGVFVAPAEANPDSSWLSGWSYRKSNVINLASGAGTNYQIGVRVDYNYTAYYDLSTQWTTISGNPTNRHNFEPVHKTNILEVDKVIDGATRKYLAYDHDPTGSQIRLYYTNDLSGSWTPYSGNPILSAPGATHYCWPAVVYDGTTFHMFVEDNTDIRIKRYTSTDGITFTFQENMVVAANTIYMDPFPWFNPNDNRWYLYHQLYSTAPENHQLLVRNSTTIAGLTTATDKIILTGGGIAAPSVMYRDGYYWLLAESGVTGTWEIHAFRSSSPSSNFLETTNSPILSGNEACPVSLLSPDGTTAYLFTAHLSGGIWYDETREIYSTRASSPSNNSEVNLNSLCRTDFGDIRFTSSDGSTLLNYWMESKVDGSYATFWVKITNDLGSSPATIYTYYGKSDATTTSSGAGTFLLFDDFNDASLNAMWAVGGTGGSVSESGGTVTITAPNGGIKDIYSNTLFGLNSRVVARASRVITASGDPSADVGFRSADGLYRAMGSGYQDSSSPNFYVETRNGGSVTELQGDLARDNNYHMFYVMRTSSSAVDLAINSMATHNVRSTTNIPTGNIPAMVLSYNLGVNIVDWIAVTKYVSPEPSHGSWGSQESADMVAPTYSSISASPTYAGQNCNFNITGNDNVALSKYIFSTNNTGLWVNDTATSFASTPQTVTKAKTLTSTIGVHVGYRWYLNDTSNNWVTTPVQSLTTIDGAPPASSYIGRSSSYAGSSCTFSCLWSDNNALSQYIFSFDNGVGSWANDTAVSFSGTSAWANVTKTLTGTAVATVRYRWYAKDTANNWASTAIQSFITLGDTIMIDKSSVTDDRVNVGSSQTVGFHASWAINGSDVVGGNIYVNGTGYVTNDTGWIFFVANSPAVGKANWAVTGVNCRGVTLYLQTVQNPSIIWDGIKIVDGGVTKRSVTLGETTIIWFKALYEYDNVAFDSAHGVLSINGSAMTWSIANNRWEYSYVVTTGGSKAFSISGVSDLSYGLTRIDDAIGPQIVSVWSSPFSVISNSTVSELAFNSTIKELSFVVSGPSGTMGYTNVTIAKTLIANISQVRVYLDGNQISYAVDSTNYYWYLSFTYHHSSHKILMNLYAPQALPSPEPQHWALTLSSGITITAMAVAVATLVAVTRRRRRVTDDTK